MMCFLSNNGWLDHPVSGLLQKVHIFTQSGMRQAYHVARRPAGFAATYHP